MEQEGMPLVAVGAGLVCGELVQFNIASANYVREDYETYRDSQQDSIVFRPSSQPFCSYLLIAGNHLRRSGHGHICRYLWLEVMARDGGLSIAADITASPLADIWSILVDSVERLLKLSMT